MTPATKKGLSPRGLMGENRPTLWLAPLLAVVTLFYLYPAFEVLRYSITNASLLDPDYEYTLETFARVLGDPVLYKVLRTTAIFVIASIVLQLLLGL
ncbi:MAG: sugar ABC transporter permease, partial [Actinomycetota bacterium]|nr:sugar ABC transporter permease [Actinomycetota bacterium]